MYLLLFSQQGTAKIELDRENAFALTIQAKDFSIISEKTNVAFYSLGGSFDYEGNKEKLMQIVDRNAFQPSNIIGREVNAWILSDGDNYLGSITFDGIDKSSGRIKVNFTFLGGNANWVKKLPEYLFELDLGETLIVSDSTITALNVYAGPYDPDEGVLWFSYKIYNVFPYSGGKFIVGESGMRPDLYFKAIIDAIAESVELNIVSQIFSTEWFRRWLMPFTGESGLKHHSVTLDTPPGIPMTGFLATSLWNEAFDPSNFHDAGTDRFLTNALWEDGSNVYVELQIELTVSSGNNAVVHMFDGLTLESLDSANLIVGDNNIRLIGSVQANSHVVIFVEGSCNLSAGEIRYITGMPILVQSHYIVNNTPINNDIKTIDFINDLTLFMNLVWYHDAKSQKLIVDSKWGAELTTGEVVDGFYQSSTFAEKWGEFLDCKNEKFNDLSFGYKEIEWRFKMDDNDDYVLNPKTYGWSEAIKNKGNNQINENKVFAPTINVTVPDSYVDSLDAPFTENAILPVMGTPDHLENIEAVQRFNFLPRMLFKVGVVDWSLNHIDTLGVGWLSVAFQQIDIRGNANINDVDPTALIANLTYEDWNGIPGFISTFYKPDILIWKHGGRKTVTVNIPLLHFIDIEKVLRYKKMIGFRDTGTGLYIIESARLLLNKPGVTELQLIDLATSKVTTIDK